jgi:DHA1 family tetracycline resistance protein-like MFS transporter
MVTGMVGPRRRLVWVLSLGSFFESTTWMLTMQAQTAIGLTLASQTQLVAAMGLCTSASAGMQFAVQPVLGVLTDRFGQQPILVLSQLLQAILRWAIAWQPTSWALLLLHRVGGMFAWYAYDTASSAALSESLSGYQLAAASGWVDSAFSVALLAGPPIGGWLADIEPRLAFGLAGCNAAVNALLLAIWFKPATTPGQPKQARGRGLAGSVNPLGFLRLFTRGRRLRLLTVVAALQAVCDCTSDVDRLYAHDVLGLSFAAEGRYQSARGLVGIAGGQLVGPLLARLGSEGFTLAANTATVAFFCMVASGRPSLYVAALMPYAIGGISRGAAVRAEHAQAAARAGCSAGELAADLAAARAVVQIVGPSLFSALYARSTRLRGLAYWVAAALACVAQLASSCARVENVGTQPGAKAETELPAWGCCGGGEPAEADVLG